MFYKNQASIEEQMVCFLLIPQVASTDDQSDFRFFTRLYSERSKMAKFGKQLLL